MRCCQPAYQTPDGFNDLPFVYVFDADALVDGADVRNLAVPVGGLDHDFYLRKIGGGTNVVAAAPGRISLRDPLGFALSSAPLYRAAYDDAGVVPELYYPNNSIIGLDLVSVLRRNNTVGINISYASQMAFWGVRRRRGERNDQSSYRWEGKQYIYTQQFTFDAGFISSPVPRRVIVAVQNRDFDLHALRVFDVATGAFPVLPFFKLTLYDRFEEGLASAPVLVEQLCENSPVATGSAFVPALYYPAGSQIRLDITSLYWAAQLPITVEIEFVGVERMAR